MRILFYSDRATTGSGHGGVFVGSTILCGHTPTIDLDA